MKTSASSETRVPVVVVPVAAVNGPPIAIGGTADGPRPALEPDGHSPGDRVEVAASHGSWLPATLIERRGERWLVHYDQLFARGTANGDTEELVERDRIRVPLAPVEEDMGPDDVDP
jgi:hypothetical protein